jgi:hypothetical protein
MTIGLREDLVSIKTCYQPGDCILPSDGCPAVVQYVSFDRNDEALLWISWLTLSRMAVEKVRK